MFDNLNHAQLCSLAEQAIEITPPGEWREDLKLSLEMYKAGTNRMRIFYLLMLEKYPVDIETFLFDPQYMNAKRHLWPEMVPFIKEVNNPDGDRLGMRYHEVVLTGGIGTAKTTQALYGLAYQLYLLSCYREPHLVLGQDPSAEILFIFQSINTKVAKNDYLRFRRMIERSPYFRDNFNFRRDIETVMLFPHSIEVQPVTGEVTATIGTNVLGGLIDEVNFMIRTKKSKKSSGGSGDFDQASELYNSIDSRRKSRFMELGCVPGLLFIASSKNYPGQFTDLKEKEALTNPGIYYWDKRIWDVRPNKFGKERFPVFVGDISTQPFIVDERHPAPKGAQAKGLIDWIPMDYLDRFKADIYNSLREIAGRSTLSTCPYMPNARAVSAAFRPAVQSVVLPTLVDFDQIFPMAYPQYIFNRHLPRAVHVDLAINGDIAGISCGYVEKFVSVQDEGESYMMPFIRYDFVMGVRAPSGDDIQFSKIRLLIVQLFNMGVPIKWISFDTFQSKDSQQILKQKGFITGEVSVDVTPLPYDCFKTAINQGRVAAPPNEDAMIECIRLERGADGKVDHPADGSKDMSDSMAGVCYVLTMRRENWMLHGVQPKFPVRDVSRKIGD